MTTAQNQRDDPPQDARRPQPQPPHSLFSVPTPIKQLFDRFPILTYAANDLPQRAPRKRNAHTLYVFATERGVVEGAPSFNPGCLKWQAYLKFSGIDFQIASSNNHASPSGALPFLLPSIAEGSKPPPPVPSGKLQRWSMNNSPSAIEEPGDLRYEAYLSLLDHRIRRAWLYNIYLSANSTSLAEPLYILPTSSNPFVRLSTARSLRSAASTELLKHSAVINAQDLYEQAEEAFAALEMALSRDEWFFGAKKPGLFDASVFAYTHLLLDDGLGNGWVETRLRDAVRSRKNLVAHRERIRTSYFSATTTNAS